MTEIELNESLTGEARELNEIRLSASAMIDHLYQRKSLGQLQLLLMQVKLSIKDIESKSGT